MALIEEVQSKANSWIRSPVIDEKTKALVKSLLENQDSKELIDSFYKDLEFGTGGLRGVMGAGSNCMNHRDLPITSIKLTQAKRSVSLLPTTAETTAGSLPK